MSFAKRWNPRPKPLACPTCNKRPANLMRPDKLCANCAGPLDAQAREVEKAEKAKRDAGGK